MNDATQDTPYIRGNLQGVSRWNPTAPLPGERDGGVHRMDLNECPYPPSPKVVAAIAGHAANINRYPDGMCAELTARLSVTTGIPGPNICYGNGSTELLSNVIGIAVAPGDGLVAATPIWRRFSGIFRIVEANVNAVANRADGGLDARAMVAAIGNDTRIVVCVTPNNPTGMMLSAAEVELFANETPGNVLLYIDEAYHEFAIHAGGPDCLEILKKRAGPWVLTRTFSKAYALAGLRLGYALCSTEEIANALRLMASTFNITALAEVAVLAALDDPDYTQMILDQTARERDRLAEGFRALGLEPLPSVTNFISVDIGRDGAGMAAQMAARNIRIATWGEDGYENFIRVSMGLPEDTDALLAALAEILAA